ncbi:MAG TPA: hypothetical protein VFE27_24295 [Acidobacteriaceae bacterium]|jgi:hypothetical protein|nr:hypothetical protein [Acidobacteriaceae bacterium]
MNKTVPGAKNWPDQKKRSRLRVIDIGTPYDCTGRMIRWAREMRSGKMGRVTDVIITARCINSDGSIDYEHFANGTGSRETFHAMASSMLKRHSGVPE